MGKTLKNMEATELRIGNFIYKQIPKKDTQLQLVEVLSIDGSFEFLDVKNSESYITEKCSLKAFEPIPLTEEWLGKFGFDIKDKDRLDWVKGAFNLERSNEDNNKFCFEVYSHYIPLDYVHQLQNLYFALTGEELKLK